MPTVTLDGATRRYPGTESDAVHALNLHIHDGEFMVLVGPSGCGKTTALRMLAGLEPCDSGNVLIGERNVTKLAPKARDIAMVFQNYALYPHMTVAENISFHLTITKMPKAEIAQRVREAAFLLDLEAYLDRKPAQLSGGQRQRVAMGRAIVRQPQVFLMDEPLSNLDAQLRVQTRTQIAELQRRFGISTLYVTHDQVEALTMGDRIAVIRDGVLLQCDTPRTVFTRPGNAFVAGFIGSPAMNLLTFAVDQDGARLGDLVIPLSPIQRASLTGLSITVGMRPEALKLTGEAQPGLCVAVDAVEELGSDTYLYTKTVAGADAAAITVRCEPFSVHGRGERLTLIPDMNALHFFDGTTGERLPD
jgi:multiple sugar transport system ATP-binding protein